MSRTNSYGEDKEPSLLDRIGRSMSVRAVEKYLGPAVKLRCADIGCGYDAKLGRRLFRNGSSLLLVDLAVAPSPKSLESRETIVIGSLPDVLEDVASQSVERLLLNNVLEHVFDAQGLLDEVYRLLSVKGRAAINVPSWRGKYWLEKAAFKWGLAPAQEMNDHKTYYDPKDLWPLLVLAGFVPVKISVTRHKFGLNTLALVEKT